MSECLCTVFMYGAHGGQKRTFDPLKLELEIVVSCCTGAHLTTEPSVYSALGSVFEGLGMQNKTHTYHSTGSSHQLRELG